jgi:hypothetical protein
MISKMMPGSSPIRLEAIGKEPSALTDVTMQQPLGNLPSMNRTAEETDGLSHSMIGRSSEVDPNRASSWTTTQNADQYAGIVRINNEDSFTYQPKIVKDQQIPLSTLHTQNRPLDPHKQTVKSISNTGVVHQQLLKPTSRIGQLGSLMPISGITGNGFMQNAVRLSSVVSSAKNSVITGPWKSGFTQLSDQRLEPEPSLRLTTQTPGMPTGKSPELTLALNAIPAVDAVSSERKRQMLSQTGGQASEPVLEISQVNSTSATDPARSASDSASGVNAVVPGSMSIQAIADKVYRILERRLTIERERRGLFQ